MTPRGLPLAAACLLAAAISGCAHGMRFSAIRPGVNQAVCVASGDRLFFEMRENASTGFRWDWTCDDPDVEVSMDHVPPERSDLDGAPGMVKVSIRIHRGYDGPSAVTFMLKRDGSGMVSNRFTITFFRRTGDAAFWE
ncbi:MAG: protease inhibitor I42 family protein [Kiritimatiellae bacterium]|nr:protease inhibitor I42 family protein [Kiritimatiellia bacterium]